MYLLFPSSQACLTSFLLTLLSPYCTFHHFVIFFISQYSSVFLCTPIPSFLCVLLSLLSAFSYLTPSTLFSLPIFSVFLFFHHNTINSFPVFLFLLSSFFSSQASLPSFLQHSSHPPHVKVTFLLPLHHLSTFSLSLYKQWRHSSPTYHFVFFFS